MPTELKAVVTQVVAEKIYGNHLKGNPPFKPWKGMEQCAWFGYDGDPYAGDLTAEGKTLLVKIMADIPGNAPRVTKKELEEWHDKRMATVPDRSAAEAQMWHTFVGGLGKSAECGMLIVEVGLSRFSRTDGKFLLVNNRGLEKLRFTANQALSLGTLINQTDPNRSQAIATRINENTRTHGSTFYVYYPSGEPKSELALTAFAEKYLKPATGTNRTQFDRYPSAKELLNKKKKIKTSAFWSLT